MSYLIDNNTGSQSFFAPGVNENAFLTDFGIVGSQRDGGGQKVLRYFFQDALGNKFEHTEFPIDEAQARQAARSFNADPEKFVRDSYATLGERMKHIASAYVNMVGVELRGNSFEEYVANYKALFPTDFATVAVRVLCCYNGKSTFLSFPKRAITPFIERMDTPTKIVIHPKYHKLIAPVKADANTSASPATAASNVYAPTPQPVAAAPQPVVQPVVQPVAQPSVQPAAQPIVQPVAQPMVQPVAQPVAQPVDAGLNIAPAAPVIDATPVAPVAQAQPYAQPEATPGQPLAVPHEAGTDADTQGFLGTAPQKDPSNLTF